MEVIKVLSLTFFLTLLLITPCFSINALTEDPPAVDWQITNLSDGWYGVQGGLKGRPSYVGLTDVRVELDLDKLMHLPGYSALIEPQNLNGLRPNLYVNSLQGFDNFEFDRFSTMTFLYQLWLQKQIGKSWSVLVGFYDLNSEFNLTDSSTPLILPAFGNGTDISQSGPNGPSVWPITGIAARIKCAPTPHTYFQAALFDAGAANPLNRAFAYMPFSSGDGLLGIYEAGYLFLNLKDGGSQGKIALGLWGYSKKTLVQAAPGFTSTLPAANNYGYYILLDYPLYTNALNNNRNIRSFVRYGTAAPLTNNFNVGLAAGFTLSGFVPGRKDDVISFGLAPAWTTPVSRLANPGLGSGEFQYEFTWSMVLKEWITFQPDLIYISFPNADRADFKNALLLGFRVTLELEKIKGRDT